MCYFVKVIIIYFFATWRRLSLKGGLWKSVRKFGAGVLISRLLIVTYISTRESIFFLLSIEHPSHEMAF